VTENSILDNIQTAETLLEALRKGQTQKLELGLGALKIPCRLLNASEEAIIVVKAKQKALLSNPTGMKQEVFESYEAMKGILKASTSIEGTVGFNDRFLEALSASELAYIYDQFVSLNHTINPNFQNFSAQEINDLVEGIKKKTVDVNSLFTYQLAGVGKWCLTNILKLPTDSEPGSQ